MSICTALQAIGFYFLIPQLIGADMKLEIKIEFGLPLCDLNLVMGKNE